MIRREDTTGIVLCGGKGSRLNGEDKPLLELGSQRMIDHVCDRLAPQVDSIVISCSRNVAIYEGLHHRLCVDRENDRGPLAGLSEAFELVQSEWVVTTPGDTPFLSLSLVERLGVLAESQGVAVPTVDGYRQNLCLLLNRARREELQGFYENGGTAVKDWLDDIAIHATDLTDIESSFFNVNTEAELTDAVKLILDIEQGTAN